MAKYSDLKSFIIIWEGILNGLKIISFIYTLPLGNDKTLLFFILYYSINIQKIPFKDVLPPYKIALQTHTIFIEKSSKNCLIVCIKCSTYRQTLMASGFSRCRTLSKGGRTKKSCIAPHYETNTKKLLDNSPSNTLYLTVQNILYLRTQKHNTINWYCLFCSFLRSVR